MRLKAVEKIITIVQEVRENDSETSFKEFIKNIISVKRVRDRAIKTKRGPRLTKESKKDEKAHVSTETVNPKHEISGDECRNRTDVYSGEDWVKDVLNV